MKKTISVRQGLAYGKAFEEEEKDETSPTSK